MPLSFPFVLSTGQNVSAFLFFAFCLSLPSGYSWGAGSTALLALLGLPYWLRQTVDTRARTLALLFVVLGLFWSNVFSGGASWESGELGLKYGLAAVSVLGASVITVSVRAIAWGLIAGSVSGCWLAFLQFNEIGRAKGYTNAIQFGDIATVLGIMSACFCLLPHLRKAERVLLGAAAMLALLTSFLSLSRGGWLLLLCIPFLFCLFAEQAKKRLQYSLVLSAVGLIAMVAAFQVPMVAERVDAAYAEASSYLKEPEKYATTSTGQRLEQWRLAWKMGNEKPLTGWRERLEEGKQHFVDQGAAHPSVLDYDHAHNEWFDTWARYGLPGVLLLFAAYAVPVIVFYPSRARLQRIGPERRMQCKVLRISGLSLAVGVFVFGLTQAFFSHNSGVLFYLFATVFLFSALCGAERAARKATA